ncbi:hypothetical protein T492DRAFT_1018945, partial [Pavlovales sp. CCMP2436]
INLVADDTGRGAPQARNIVWAIGHYLTTGAGCFAEGTFLVGSYVTLGAASVVNGHIITQAAANLDAAIHIPPPGFDLTATFTLAASPGNFDILQFEAELATLIEGEYVAYTRLLDSRRRLADAILPETVMVEARIFQAYASGVNVRHTLNTRPQPLSLGGLVVSDVEIVSDELYSPPPSPSPPAPEIGAKIGKAPLAAAATIHVAGPSSASTNISSSNVEIRADSEYSNSYDPRLAIAALVVGLSCCFIASVCFIAVFVWRKSSYDRRVPHPPLSVSAGRSRHAASRLSVDSESAGTMVFPRATGQPAAEILATKHFTATAPTLADRLEALWNRLTSRQATRRSEPPVHDNAAFAAEAPVPMGAPSLSIRRGHSVLPVQTRAADSSLGGNSRYPSEKSLRYPQQA